MTTGAEILIETALELGLDTCFANPGTTELPLVRALDARPGMRSVLGLHENVCTGAADGYARMAGKPASTLLHLGPGLANGLANLHNARRAFSPVVNLVGEHASWHVSADPPLASDIESLARPVSGWFRRAEAADGIPRDLRDAWASATSGRGSVSTLVLPHDHQLAATHRPVRGRAAPLALPAVDDQRINQASALLRGARRPAVLLGGMGLHGAGLRAAGRLGATLICEVGFARLETGLGLPPLVRLPYFPDQAKALLDQFDGVVVCGTKLPVSFFGYADMPDRYLEQRSDDTLHLAGPGEDAVGALEALADLMGRPASAATAEAHEAVDPSAPLDPTVLGAVVAPLIPEGAICVVTAVSSGQAIAERTVSARPHTQLALTGGAIGEGSALALGAAVACPDRKVIAIDADGSAAYLVQALYSQARESTDITTIICSNRRYRILDIELQRAGVNDPGEHARSLGDLGSPPIDWVAVARGFGVPGERARTAGELEAALRKGLATPGPLLIEAVL